MGDASLRGRCKIIDKGGCELMALFERDYKAGTKS